MSIASLTNNSNSAGYSAVAATQVMNSPVQNAGAGGGAGGLLSQDKDSKTASTDAQFGEVFKQIQAKYGAKPEKPREIKKTLGKDDFLRIMVTQMKNQDPTSPFKPEQMAAEMAQFTSVEQLQNLNQGLSKMQTQNQPLERMAMTNLIGKVVTVDRERFPHTENSNDSLNFTLPKDAKSVKVAVLSETGETMLEKDLGALKAGENSFTWDGVKTNTLQAKTGTYMFRVSAQDDNGQSLATNPQGQARIIGVSFEGAEPVFLVGNAAHQDKVTMKNIVRIEDGGAGGEMPQGAMGGGLIQNKGPNFIAFKKGEGSGALDSNSAPPEVAEAIARFQAQQAAQAQGEARQATVAAPAQESAPRIVNAPPRPAQVAAAAPDIKAEGFPNGLHDDSGSNPGTLERGGEK